LVVTDVDDLPVLDRDCAGPGLVRIDRIYSCIVHN
jgi:hypothetical protein